MTYRHDNRLNLKGIAKLYRDLHRKPLCQREQL